MGMPANVEIKARLSHRERAVVVAKELSSSEGIYMLMQYVGSSQSMRTIARQVRCWSKKTLSSEWPGAG